MRPSSIFLLLQLILLLSAKISCQEDIRLKDCGANTNYTAGSLYESNLSTLLANLTSSVSNSASFFSTNTIGSSLSDQIFGLAQCRPDVSAATCFECLNSSSTARSANAGGCHFNKSAALRSDHCMLRFSDENFFTIPEVRLSLTVYNLKASNSTVFDQAVRDLVGKLSLEAAKNDSRFSVGVTNYSELGDIYGMAWCTMDLSRSDCLQCLDQANSSLPFGKVGGQSSRVSCIVNFATSSFYSTIWAHSSPPPPQLQTELTPPPVPSVRTTPAAYEGKSSSTTKTVLLITIPVVFGLALLCAICIWSFRRKKTVESVATGHLLQQEDVRSAESLVFDLDTVRAATDDFSEENKLGEGGFGHVYKGLLEDGQQIAVKRLSSTSSQGLVELKNEVLLLAKLQHRNLVRLIGFCLQESEKLLVYEYLPNTSLDKFLFDPVKRLQLDWGARYRIIEGIGRGLLYLHEDSRLRIIHRDLKASNILLDDNIKPKISDFGLARLFEIDQTQQNTSRIAGTYGYMAPEYALHGIFSAKSDVFSYGVLILEIITGRRNVDLPGSPVHALDLLCHVWQCWNKGVALQLVDACLGQQYKSQVLRCMHIGLLCVQDDASQRPNMASVMLMITSSSMTLPAPTKPLYNILDINSGESMLSVEDHGA